MELTDLITFFEDTGLQRVAVFSRNNGDITSYKSEAENISIEINEETYTEINRVCFVSKSDNIYLYLHHLTRRNLDKFDISSIETITIPWKKKKTDAMAVAIANGMMEIKANAIISQTIVI